MNDSPIALVHAKGLRKDFGSGEGLVRALDMVDLDVNRGEVIPALPGAILGLPLGIGLFKVAGHHLTGLPPVLWLVAAA